MTCPCCDIWACEKENIKKELFAVLKSGDYVKIEDVFYAYLWICGRDTLFEKGRNKVRQLFVKKIMDEACCSEFTAQNIVDVLAKFRYNFDIKNIIHLLPATVDISDETPVADAIDWFENIVNSKEGLCFYSVHAMGSRT